MINIACWSIGEHAQRNILPAILATPLLTLTGIFTRNINTQKKITEEYDCIGYQSEEELLADNSVHAVYISSPNGCHFKQIKHCLDAGKSVLVEKTAITNLNDAEFIVQLAKEKNLVVMEAFMYQFHRQFKKLKELMNDQAYGQVIRLNCDFGFPHLPKDNIRYNPSLDGGALFDAGAYTLSAARSLLSGKIQILGAYMNAEGGYKVDTKGFAMLRDDKDIISQCSWVFGGSYINKISVWCQNAHIIVERAFSKPPTFESNIQISVNGTITEDLQTGSDNHFVHMLNHFVAELDQGHLSQELVKLLQQAQLIEQVKLKSNFKNA